MIARIWHDRTKASDADAYLEYLFQSGVPAVRPASLSAKHGSRLVYQIEFLCDFHSDRNE